MSDNLTPSGPEASEPTPAHTHYSLPDTDRTFGAIQNRLRGSILLKIVLTVILALILLIPASMIHDLVQERQERRTEARSEISNKWGREQTLGGPILTLPYIAADTHTVH